MNDITVLKNALSQAIQTAHDDDPTYFNGIRMYKASTIWHATGHEPKNRPSRWLANKHTASVLNAFNEFDGNEHIIKDKESLNTQATIYLSQQGVLAYCAWISPKVNAAAIYVFHEYLDGNVSHKSDSVTRQEVAGMIAEATQPIASAIADLAKAVEQLAGSNTTDRATATQAQASTPSNLDWHDDINVVTDHSDKYVSVREYCAIKGYATTAEERQFLGGKCYQHCTESYIPIDKRERDYRQRVINKYPMWVVDTYMTTLAKDLAHAMRWKNN